MLVMFFVKRYKLPQNEPQTTDDTKNAIITNKEIHIPMEQSPRTRKMLIALYALFLGLYSSIESVYFALSPTYFQYLPNVVISAQKAADIMIVMTITYTLGRFLSAFISIKLKAEVMLTYHFVIMGIALAILYIAQTATTTTLLYIGNGIIGKIPNHNPLSQRCARGLDQKNPCRRKFWNPPPIANFRRRKFLGFLGKFRGFFVIFREISFNLTGFSLI